MRLIFTENAWEDYTSWMEEDKKVLNKLNELIREIQRTPYKGRGKPEPLRFELAGMWSRRIDREHRLIYRVENKEIIIYSCRYHYDK